MVYSDWLSPGLGQEPGPRHGQMGCMVICRTFHTAPEQEQGVTPIVPHCSDSGSGLGLSTGHSQCDYTISTHALLNAQRWFPTVGERPR